MPLDLQTRDVIARGGQGSVLLVWDRSHGRFLALKLVEVSGGEAAVKRLLDDLGRYPSGDPDPPGAVVDFGNALHPPAGVASAFPTLVGGRRIWILMFYIHGPNARELGEGDPAFGPTEVAALLAQVAVRLRGLEPGRAHLDLKPENILVDRAGRAHLVDFHMGTTEGTPGFNAPEQRSKTGIPGPAADLYALAKTGAWLLAHRLPRESDDPELFPQLPEAPTDLQPEKRRNVKELGQLIRSLCHPDPEKRGTIEEVAKRLIEIAAALGGPDLAAPLAASVARAKLPERFEHLDEVLAEEAQQAKEHPMPGRQPGGPTAEPGRAARRVVPFAAAAVAILFVALIALYLQRLDHPEAQPAAATPAAPTSARCQVSPPARLLEPLEAASPKHALFQETVVEPAGRVSLKVLNGPEVLALPAPQPGDDCKIDLPAGIYRWDEVYPDGLKDGHTLLLATGQNEHDLTHHYVHAAPIDPNRRDLFRMLNPENGPTVLFRGPLLLATALWDSTAGTVAIAPHGSDCRGSARALPRPSGGFGPGTFEPMPHLRSDEDLCGVPTPSASAGFGVHLEVISDTTSPIDPAKRFILDRKLEALRETSLLLDGPLFLTSASWNADAGTVKLAYGHCDNDFRDLVPLPTTDLPTKVENGRSVCAMPDPVHLGRALTVHLEGYRL